MRSSPFRIVSGLSVLLASALVLTVGASLATIQINRAIAWLILVASGVAAAVTARWLPPSSERVPPPTGRVFVVASGAVVALAAVLWVALLVPALAKPDLSWDGNSYHIPAIHHWALRGYVHWIAPEPAPLFHWPSYVDNLLNGYPKGLEVLAFLSARAAGTSHPVNAVNLAFLPLGAFGVASIARRIGASAPSSAISGALFLFVPVCVTQATTTYVDAALAASVAVVAAGALEATADVLAGRSAVRAIPALGAGVGLTLSIKASGLSLGLLPLVVLGVLIVVRGRARLRGHLLFLGGVVAVVLVVAGYFYVRNAWHKGNPIYPVQVTLGGREILPGIPLREQITETGVTPAFMSGWPAWRKIAFAWTQGYRAQLWPGSIRFFDAREGGLGFLWLLAGLPAALVVAGMRARAARSARSWDEAIPYFVLFAHILICFALAPLSWWARYTVWLHVLGLPAAAVVLDGVLSRFVLARVATLAWALSVGYVAAYECHYAWGYSTGIPFFVAIRTPPRSASEVVQQLTTYKHPNYMFAEGLPEWSASVFGSSSGFAFGPLTVSAGPVLGLLSMPVGERPFAYLPSAALVDDEAFRRFCKERRIRFVVWDENIASIPPPIDRAARRRERFDPFWTLFDLAPTDEPLVPVRAK